MKTLTGNRFFGASLGMKLRKSNGDIVLESKYYQNIIILLVLSIIVLLIHQLVYINYVFFVLGCTTCVAFTYRKKYRLYVKTKELKHSIKLLGINFRKRVYDFSEIGAVTLSAYKSPLVGLQVPISLNNFRLDIKLNNRKDIFIDKTTDYMAILEYAKEISSLIGIPITDLSNKT